MKPLIKSGTLRVGADFECGENVVIDVAEEVVLGNRVTLGDNTYLSGRRVEIGSDFYGYSWEFSRLDVGRGRRDEESAILIVGNRCTFHNNRIDLARAVTINNDVGLSPEVAIYTHYYWQNSLEGHPCEYAPVTICSGTLVGFRSVVLPGVTIGPLCMVGAQSVVAGDLTPRGIHAGNPARWLGPTCDRFQPMPGDLKDRCDKLRHLMEEYCRSCVYRMLLPPTYVIQYPCLHAYGCSIHVESGVLEGQEDEHVDDLRWFLFTRGIRIYTKRRFKKLGRKA